MGPKTLLQKAELGSLALLLVLPCWSRASWDHLQVLSQLFWLKARWFCLVWRQLPEMKGACFSGRLEPGPGRLLGSW